MVNLTIFGVGGGDFDVLSYDPGQDFGRFSVSADHSAVTLVENAWKRVKVDKTITSDTVMSFEFASTFEGDIHGIGFDTDNDVSTFSQDTFFQLDGPQQYGLQAFNGAYETGSGFKRYEIRIGDFFTGDFENLVFNADHDLFPVNPGDPGPDGDSIFRNITFTEVPKLEIFGVGGGEFSVLSYDMDQDFGRASVTADQIGVTLVENTWKRVEINQTITPDTVLSFEFASTFEGDIHGIGFDTDNDVETFSQDTFFQLDGPQQYGLQAFNGAYETGSGFKRYEIRIGDFFTGNFENLVFNADHDEFPQSAGDPGPDGDSIFRNITFTEVPQLEIFGVGGGEFSVLSYDMDQDFGRASISADQSAVTLVENTWKRVEINKTITLNTVMSFEFASTFEGDIHGIGFDTDNDVETFSQDTFFQLDGPQEYGLQDFNGEYTTGSGFRRYEIKVGEFFTGDFENLVFNADHDEFPQSAGDPGPDGDSIFRNITFTEEPANPIAPAVFKLADLDGSNGFRIEGGPGTSSFGIPIVGLGDVNGDGIDDFIFGKGPRSTVVFGSRDEFPETLDLQFNREEDGFRIESSDAITSIGGAGDFNGDGLNDIIIAVKSADPNGLDDAGETYVIFGSSSGFEQTIDVSTLDPGTGFRISGLKARDGLGTAVSGAGDFNGDGFDDIILAAETATPLNNSYGSGPGGAAYVIFGSDTGFETDFDLSTLDGSNGFSIPGGLYFVRQDGDVSGGGDFNGDGFDDVIASFTYLPFFGTSFVLFGSGGDFPSSVDTDTLDGTNGLVLNFTSGRYFSGAVSAGDINGDGFDDFLGGKNSFFFDENGPGRQTGDAFVLFGKESGFAAIEDATVVDGTNGFRIGGTDGNDGFGVSVSSAGDFNGDGIEDFIVGAFGGDPDGNSRAGESYLVFGSLDGFPATLSASSLDGSNGFRLDGVSTNDTSGRTVAAAGDINGDGFDDVAIDAGGANGRKGEVYIVFGGPAGPGSAPVVQPAISAASSDENGVPEADLERVLSAFQDQPIGLSPDVPLAQSSFSDPNSEAPLDDGTLWLG